MLWQLLLLEHETGDDVMWKYSVATAEISHVAVHSKPVKYDVKSVSYYVDFII